jgi:hypothetical protein
MSKRSLVHEYFSKLPNMKYKCIKCDLTLSAKNGSTSVLRNHLKYRHAAEYASLTNNETVKKSALTMVKKHSNRINLNGGTDVEKM